nr:hypothetical protein CFP56_47761 [Quercus suber]
MGYRFLKEGEVGFQVAEHQDHEKGLWKKIWALECPNKICDRCKEDNEDVVHAVWGCKELDGVRTQQAFRPLNQLSQWAHDRCEEYKALKPASLPSRPKRRVRWKPPDQDTFKINFDGVIFAEDKCSGLGVIIRNQEGLVIASMSTQVPQQLQPIEIEALAASNALGFAREVAISEAVLEGNSSLVMTALKTKNPGLAPFGLLIQDSLSLSSGFSKLYYSHTKRKGNIVAHSLAQLAVNFLNSVIWMEDVPSDVLSSYYADLVGIS